MKFAKYVVLCAVLIGLTGCYNAKVTTDVEPSNKTVEKSFAPGFIFGLVGPTVDVSDQCTNGVAKVQTKLSFVNMLVSNITFGLYTPMNIEVTCAATSSSLEIDELNSDEYAVINRSKSDEFSKDLQKASRLAAITHKPILIK